MTDVIAGILEKGGHSLVVVNGDRRYTFEGRGISDLYCLLTERPEVLCGASVADKVIGKGAAALMALGGVSDVFARVISTPALALLRGCGIPVRFILEVPNIINRKGDGICPVERLCADCTTARECLPLIEGFMSERKRESKI